MLTSIVGVTGFEPATPCSQSRCATGLRYTPKTFFRAGKGEREGKGKKKAQAKTIFRSAGKEFARNPMVPQVIQQGQIVQIEKNYIPLQGFTIFKSQHYGFDLP